MKLSPGTDDPWEMVCSEECYFVSLMVWYLSHLEAGFIPFLPVQFESLCFGLAKKSTAMNNLWRTVWKLLFSQLDCRRNSSDSSVRAGKVQSVKHVFISKHMVGIPEAGAVHPVCESRTGITLGLVWEKQGCPVLWALQLSCTSPLLHVVQVSLARRLAEMLDFLSASETSHKWIGPTSVKFFNF